MVRTYSLNPLKALILILIEFGIIYFPMQSGFCNFSPDYVGAKITSIRVIESGNEEALAEAVQMEGPVTVAIDHMHRVFQVMSIAIAML